MRLRIPRSLTYVILTALVVFLGLLAWHHSSPGADPAPLVFQGDPAKEKPATLPVTQVILFNSGVGYYQREGVVQGDTLIQLAFPASEINDLLKSLVLQDQDKGKVGVITYDSQEPVERTLRSFTVNLNGNPTFAQLLNQLRGEKVEVVFHPHKDGPSEKLSGTIVGLQSQLKQLVHDRLVETDHINLLSSTGLRSILLEQVQTVRFLNPHLQADFERALRILATTHDTLKKTLDLQFLGNGKRRVKVGYVVERPIWKTSYRLLLKDNGKLFVQGWAMVENVSDDDWKNVRVILVSGRPISYQMNLYEPLYIPRPMVEPELFASLRPPVYGGALESGKQDKSPIVGMGGQTNNMMNPMMGNMMNPMMGMGGMGMGGMGSQMNPMMGYQMNPMMGYQMNPGMGGMMNPMMGGGMMNPMMGQKLTFEELQQRREEMLKKRNDAKKIGAALTGMNFKEGITSVATAEELGDYHQYVIEQKVNLPRQKSAMLPILNQHLDGNKVSIYNENIHAKYPLLGLRLKNTSGQPLTQGPITVYEDGAYAGDTRILDLQPGEERLLSYALDQTTEVKITSKTNPSPNMTFKIGGNTLTANYSLRQTRTYTIKNRSAQNRQVIVEHPIRSDWKLVSPAQPLERSRDMYRFQVLIPAGKTVALEVSEDQARLDSLALAGGTDQTPFYAVAAGIEVKPLVKVSPEELLKVKIVKGALHSVYRWQESKTYFIQNHSDEERKFTVDHIIAKGYQRLAKEGPQVGPAVFRFQLTVLAHKTAWQEVLEERTQDRAHMLDNIAEDKLREYLASAAVKAPVKEAFKKYLESRRQVAETMRSLNEQKNQLKILTEDQARLRENLKIIPPTSEPYKGFLQKFVAQETEIEGHQKQVRQLEAALLKQQRDLETFVQGLTVE